MQRQGKGILIIWEAETFWVEGVESGRALAPRRELRLLTLKRDWMAVRVVAFGDR